VDAAEFRTLAEYVRTLADALGLRDWDVTLAEDHSMSEEVFADVRVPRGRKHATITLGGEYFTSSQEERRATIVHELLHCHFMSLEDLIEDTLPPLIGRPAFSMFRHGHTQIIEQGVEGVSVAIAHFLPLPPEGSR
jgi:hypothetical protein